MRKRTRLKTVDPGIAPETIVVEVPPEPKPTETEVFTKADVEALLGKVRKEEKDKLYPQMNKWQEQAKAMQDELEKVRQTNEAAQQAEQERLAAEKTETDKKRREETDLRSLLDEERQRREQQELDWQNQLKTLRDEQEAEKATLAKEKEYLGLLDHRNRRIAEERENDTIDPRLYDYINGNSVEEIEASIELAKAKTDELFQEFAQAKAARPLPRGVTPTSPITGPSDMITGGTKTFTADDIKNMSMSEFQKYRQSLLGVAKPQNRGLFD